MAVSVIDDRPCISKPGKIRGKEDGWEGKEKRGGGGEEEVVGKSKVRVKGGVVEENKWWRKRK